MSGVGQVTQKAKTWIGQVQDDGGERASEVVLVPEADRAPPTAKLTEIARVRYTLGATLNLGDYRSIRVDVSVDLPCKAHKESIDRIHDYAKAWCEGKINQEVADWTGDDAIKFLPDAPADAGRKKR